MAGFWSRFEARSSEGDARAIVWQLRMLNRAELGDDEIKEHAGVLLDRLDGIDDAAVVADAVPFLIASRGAFDGDALTTFLESRSAVDHDDLRRAARLGLSALEQDEDRSLELALTAFADPEEPVTLEELDPFLADELAEKVEAAATEASRDDWDRWYLDLGGMHFRRPGAPPQPEETLQAIQLGLADWGSASAALWCLREIRGRDDATRERLARCLEQVVDAELDSDQIGRLAWQVPALIHRVGLAETERAVDAWMSRADDEAQARLQYSLGDALAERDDYEERGLAMLREVIERWPESESAGSARGKVFRYENLAVGKAAPDFETFDADGNAFRLSDYKGKVTVVDFWGFW